MRQRRWLEFLKHYNFELSYHPSKANVVAGTLSRKSLHIFALMVSEMDLLEQFRDLSLACEVTPNSVRLGTLRITSELLGDIREGQKTDPFLRNQLEAIESGRDSSFNVGSDGALQLQDRICVPNVLELRKIILEEGHRSNLSIHPNATKMYQDLKMMFWWPNMNREVSEFVCACLVYQKAKIEHQRPSRKLQPLEIPLRKWDSISMDC